MLPQRIEGRALDVGTFDGFWAFEMERRGAEVVAADLASFDDTEWPPLHRERLSRAFAGRRPGDGFELAHRLLESRVRRVESSIYDIDAQRIGGPVAFALIGALLLHLRDPVRGLEAVRSVLEPGGRLIVVEPVDLWLSILNRRRATARLRAATTEFDWWVGNVACLRDFLTLAGFAEIRRRALFRLKAVRPIAQWHVALEARRPPGPA